MVVLWVAEGCFVGWRQAPQGETTQKNVFTTQKATEELILATQKEEFATRKSKSTTQNRYTSSVFLLNHARNPKKTAQKFGINGEKLYICSRKCGEKLQKCHKINCEKL